MFVCFLYFFASAFEATDRFSGATAPLKESLHIFLNAPDTCLTHSGRTDPLIQMNQRHGKAVC